MVRAWYPQEHSGEVRYEGQATVGGDEIRKKTGVIINKIDVDKMAGNELLEKLKKERGYSWDDVIEISRKTLPDFDKKTTAFKTEHRHPDEEIRLVLDGTGFFDVRDCDDQWVRLEVERGDMLELPPNLYHRFSLGKESYIKLNRFFSSVPQWTAQNRAADDIPENKTDCEKLRN